MPSFFARGLAVGVAAAVIAAAPARADNVVSDDEIVQGSVCAGPDCVINESFGFDTVRLKGPVLRLAFLDTSTSSGFPSNDWALTANDADGAGSENYFGFTDASAGTTPLRILAGTPTDTLRLDPDGGVRLLNGALLQRVDATTTESATAADGAALVTALGTLPLSTYEYTADAANTRHLGPQAAAFNAAFGLGAGTAELAPADVAGVALAGTQELARRLDDLTGPRGPEGAKGATGPTGAQARPSNGLAAALAKLARLERGQIKLRALNLALRREVRDLRRAR